VWWKIALAVLVAVAFVAGWRIRAFFRSLLDPCPDETCRGRLKYQGDQVVQGRRMAVFGCDRCQEEVAVSVFDEQPAL
jgi:hypothetical protein